VTGMGTAASRTRASGDAGGEHAGLLVCCPERAEAGAVRRALRAAGQVRITGAGGARTRRQAARLRREAFGMLAITGPGTGLAPGLAPGDVVIAAEVGDGSTTVACPAAPLLAGELARAGVPARVGRVVTVPDPAPGSEYNRLPPGDALVADLDSAPLAATAASRPVAVVRVVDSALTRAEAGHPAAAGEGTPPRVYRSIGSVLARWSAAAGPRTVLLASPRSFCAGVERAIEIVERLLDQHGPPVYVRKQIVHNTHIVAGLRHRGAVFVEELSQVPDGACVVFSAHGVSPAVRREAQRRGLHAVDATCPLVSKVHAEARRFASTGHLVALIGHAGHEEVEGTVGEAPGAIALIETPEDVAALRPADPGKVAYLMQTTLAIDEASDISSALRRRFPDARAPGSDDICYATTNRQYAVRAIAAEAGLILVAGSANSSNSVRLVETARRAGTPAYLIDGPSDIQLGWLAGVRTIGLTAGASAPPAVVSDIISALSGLGPVEVSERVITTEHIRFGLPKEVRPPRP
jgi:4-hydroxy-3-methylbut-2-en-1-yl diphosphate reductase